MLSSWSVKRKLSYLAVFIAFIIVLVGVPLFFIWYEKPSCFDEQKNGDEAGVDCGGSCQLLCSFEAIDLNILWARSFKVTPGVYSITAYIENPNINSEARNVSYVFNLYDNTNTLIATRQGNAFIPKHRIFAVFEPNIQIVGKVPTRTTFEFTEIPKWYKDTSIPPEIAVYRKSLSNEGILPRIDGTIENRSPGTVLNVEVIALVFDGEDNAIGASRTYIDSLMRGQSADVVFTWPLPFETQTTVCKIPSDVIMVIDRSGSMASDGTSPPQPLTDVKNAAISFVNQLEADDGVGLVSYATEASTPIDATLSFNFDAIKNAISLINIKQNGIQQTNIADGIEKALLELTSERHRNTAKKVLIMLTDGEPTLPQSAQDELYPQNEAVRIADQAKSAGVQLYTVGLGTEVDQDFLLRLASSPEHHFGVISSDALAVVYNEIATSICEDRATSIELIAIPREVIQ